MSGTRPAPHRIWMRSRRFRRPSRPAPSAEAVVMLAAAVIGIVSAFVISGRMTPSQPSSSVIEVLGVMESRPQPQRALSGALPSATPAPKEAAPPSQPAVVEAIAPPPPTATPPPPAADRLRVANTDGEGVVLRASPKPEDRTPRGFAEGWE